MQPIPRLARVFKVDVPSVPERTSLGKPELRLWLGQANALAIWGWALVILVLVLHSAFPPAGHTVLGTYFAAGRHWLAGAPLYEGRRGFVYSPLAAALFAPLTLLPPGAQNVFWVGLNIAAYLGAVRWWLKAGMAPEVEGKWHGVIFLLLLPLSVGNFNIGQINPLATALLVAGIVGVRQRRFAWSAFCLALCVYFKIYPVVMALLVASQYPKRFSWRFVLALALLGAATFLFQHPTYVRGQYELWAATRFSDDRRTYSIDIAPRDLWMLFRALHLPVSLQAYQALQVVSGGAIALLVLLGKWWLGWSEERRLAATLFLGTAWMLLCGPATESATYVLLAPCVVIALVQSHRQGVRGWRRSLIAAAGGVLLAALGVNSFLHLHKTIYVMSVQPLGALLFVVFCVAWLLEDALWQRAADAAVPARARSVALDTLQLQQMDRWIGVPLCLALSAGRSFGRMIWPCAPDERPPRRIVFLKLAEQGSTVLAQAAIRRAATMVGREHLYFVVFEQNRFIIDALELVPRENVLAISQRNLLALSLDTVRALRQLRAQAVDTLVDFEFFSRGSAVMAFLSGCRSRVGFHTFFGEGPYRGDLFTHRLAYNPYLHTSQIFDLMVQALQRPRGELPTLPGPPPGVQPQAAAFQPRPEEQRAVAEIIEAELARSGAASSSPPSIVLVNANTSDLVPLRRWPAPRYAELAQRLLRKFPETVVIFTGGLEEREPVEALTKSVGSTRCISLAGKTTLRQLLVLYSLADLVVTNDSGPAHFASLTQIQAIVLFGPETPALFRAPTERSRPVWLGLACSPCVNAFNNRQSPCRNNRCMQGISVDSIFDLASELL